MKPLKVFGEVEGPTQPRSAQPLPFPVARSGGVIHEKPSQVRGLAFFLLPNCAGDGAVEALLTGVMSAKINEGAYKVMEMASYGQARYREKAPRRPFRLMHILNAIILFLSFPSIAWAYVDPGSVTILLQVIFAFLLGSILAFKNRLISGLKSLFHRIFPGKKHPSDNE